MTGQAPLVCDVTRLLRRRAAVIPLTGIDRVNQAYARWVHASGGILCVLHGEVFRALSAQEASGVLETTAAPAACGRLRRWLSPLLRPTVPADGRLLFNVSHNWLDRPAAWEAARRRNLSVVTMVHDLIPVEFPEYARPGEAERHRRRLHGALAHSAAIVTNSAATLQALRTFAAEEGLRVPPAVAAPLGHTPAVRTAAPRATPSRRPHFVVLGTIEARKNHLLLLTVWRDLVARHGSSAPDLVVVGRRGWECEQVTDLLERCAALRGHLIERNDADDLEIAAWLAGARALLFPSFAEGFGMPLQEALALGVPVIASRLAPFREIAGDIPDYLSPLDGLGWRQLIESYTAPQSPARTAQLRRMSSFAPCRWDGHFTTVAELVGGLPLAVGAPAPLHSGVLNT